MKRSKQQGFGAAAVIAVVAVLAVIGFVGWRLYDAQQQANTQNQNNPQTTQPQTDPNEGYVVIKEWGVRFKPVEGLTGVQYYKTSVEGDYFAFTTDELAKADPNCSTTSSQFVLGTLTRTKEENGFGQKRGPINGYYFYSRGSDAACSSRPNELEGPTKLKLIKSWDSLEAAK